MRGTFAWLCWIALFSETSIAEPIVNVSGPYELEGQSNDWCEGWKADRQVFVVYDNSREIARYNYCSSYGESSANVVTDARGKSYIFLHYQVGRGTCAPTEYLVVLSITADREYLREPISTFVPDPEISGQNCTEGWFDIETMKVKGGGLRIYMKWAGPFDPSIKDREFLVGKVDS